MALDVAHSSGLGEKQDVFRHNTLGQRLRRSCMLTFLLELVAVVPVVFKEAQ